MNKQDTIDRLSILASTFRGVVTNDYVEALQEAIKELKCTNERVNTK